MVLNDCRKASADTGSGSLWKSYQDSHTIKIMLKPRIVFLGRPWARRRETVGKLAFLCIFYICCALRRSWNAADTSTFKTN